MFVMLLAAAAASSVPSPATPTDRGNPLRFDSSRWEEVRSAGAVGQMSDATLADEHGGSALVLSNQSLDSVVSGNSIGGNYTAGLTSFGPQSFENFSGMGNITVNTGAQSSLQSAMNVTINIGN